MLKEFKKFITRGNVIDLAVGVIIGAAFNRIVTSLVSDIITPVISWLLSFVGAGSRLDNLKIILKRMPDEANNITLNFGSFITYIIEFLLTGFAIFLLVKGINALRDAKTIIPIPGLKRGKSEEETPAPEPPKPALCPYCKSEINPEATRCPHCTSILNAKTDQS